MSEMKKKMKKISSCLFLLTAILLTISCDRSENGDYPPEEPQAGDFVKVLKSQMITTDNLAAMVSEAVPLLPPEFAMYLKLLTCDVQLTVIDYKTTGPDGNLVDASGVIIYPTAKESYNHILSIQHGTIDINNSPSDQAFPIEAFPVFADEVVVMADYLGYGISRTDDLKHTYMHLKTTGTACADMISASRQFLDEYSNMECTADSIRLLGYSQGGQATMATLFELEERGLADRISMVRAGAGPYSMSDFMKNPDEPNDRLAYTIFAIEGLIYGDNADIDRHNIYTDEFFSSGRDYILTECYLSQWNEVLGKYIRNVLNEDFFKPDYGGNKDVIKVMELMNSNSVVNHTKPLSNNIFIEFYHCPTDTYVPYSCSKTAASGTFRNCSRLHDLEMAGDHISGGVEFIIDYMGGRFTVLKLIIPLIDEIVHGQLES